MKAFIQDRERVLDSAKDLLKTSVYAENLVKVIENTPENKVFTIGVFGGWGTGKSSIIRTAQDKIESTHKDVKFVTYDAWKYANDSFRRMFLLKVQQELKMQQTEEMSRFYLSEIAEAEPRTKISGKGLAIAVGVLIVLSAILFLVPGVELEWRIAVPTIGALGTFLVALLNGCFYDLKVSINKPALFAPEQFEACFKNMMIKCLKERSWINEQWTNLKDYVETGESSVIGLEKLIVVIDNIDRCPSDMAYQLLTDVKTFLSNEEYNLVFIVPVDDEALKKHLFRKWNKQAGDDIDINKEKEEFLRKFFNVTLRIKPHQVTELQHFAHEINKENNLGYSNDTLAVVSKEFADNPRRIIQLLNNLSGNLALYDDEFVGKYETAICAALILQEVYPDFYKKVTKDLNLVKQFDETKENDESLKGFMRIAGSTLKKAPLDDLQRIFTNTSSIFSDLPVDLQKSVRSYDTAKVIEFANANEDKKNNLVDFMLESLSNDVKYGATSQTTQWIDCLCILYKNGVFDHSRFGAIDESLNSFYKAAIPAIGQANDLCFMASQMHSYGYEKLRDAVIEYLKAENAKEDSNFVTVLKAYYDNLNSEQDCKAIASVVADYYIENEIDKDVEFNDTQIEYLFGDSFVLKQIEIVTATDDESHIDDVIWCLKKNKKLASSTYTALFAKFIELFGDTRGKSKAAYLEFINHLQPILDAFENSSLTTEPEHIYKLVTKNRGIPDPNYRNQSQYDTQRSVLDDVDENEAKTLVSFCYDMMRITGGKVNVNASMNKLFTKCKDTVVEGAMQMHALGISISQLSSTLIVVDDYNSPNDLALLEIVLKRDTDGMLKLDDDTVNGKIKSLVDNSNINGVEALLKKLVSDKQILGMEADYVASLDCETINNLPVSVAKLAVSTFKRDNAETYKDNVDFLIVVLRQGTASQKKEVVRLMKDKINKEQDLENVVKVLDNLVTEDQTLLKSLVGELEGIKDSETVSDETKERIAALATKLSASIKKPGLLDKVLGKK